MLKLMKLEYLAPELEWLDADGTGIVCTSVLENPEIGGEYEWEF